MGVNFYYGMVWDLSEIGRDKKDIVNSGRSVTSI